MPGAELRAETSAGKDKSSLRHPGQQLQGVDVLRPCELAGRTHTDILLWEFPKIGDPDIVSYIVGILFARTPE